MGKCNGGLATMRNSVYARDGSKTGIINLECV